MSCWDVIIRGQYNSPRWELPEGIVQQAAVLGGNCLGVIVLSGNCFGGIFPRLELSGGQLSRGQLSRGQIVWGEFKLSQDQKKMLKVGSSSRL